MWSDFENTRRNGTLARSSSESHHVGAPGGSILYRRDSFMGAESRHPDGTRAEGSGGVSDVRSRRQIAGEWIAAKAEWTWWATLTFRGSVGEAHAMKTLYGFLHGLAHEARRHFRAAWCMESQKRGALHFHALLDLPVTTIDHGAARLFGDPEEYEFSPTWLEYRWRNTNKAAGNARVQRYDSARAAAFYLVKGGQWDLRVACPRPPSCRRRLGCTFARKDGW